MKILGPVRARMIRNFKTMTTKHETRSGVGGVLLSMEEVEGHGVITQAAY